MLDLFQSDLTLAIALMATVKGAMLIAAAALQ